MVHTDTEMTEKAVVFSHCSAMLDLLEVHLKLLMCRRLDGTMFVAAPEKAVNDLKTVREVCVQ